MPCRRVNCGTSSSISACTATAQRNVSLVSMAVSMIRSLPWISNEADDRLPKPVFRRPDMRDGGRVIVARQPHHGRGFPLGLRHAKHQLGTVDVDQRVLELRPGDECRDAVAIDMMHGRITFEPRSISAVILLDLLRVWILLEIIDPDPAAHHDHSGKLRFPGR